MSDLSATKAALFDQHGLLAPYLPQLIEMRHGLRQAIQLSLDAATLARERERIEARCAESSFSLLVYDYLDASKVLISTVRHVNIDWNDPKNEFRLGNLFGYPDCCCRVFSSNKDRIHPLVNNMRDLLEPHDQVSARLNPFLRTSPFSLVKHLLCSLACRSTLEHTGELLAHIQEDDPDLHRHITRFNRRPVLYTDVCAAGILFDGHADQNRIRYKGFDIQDEPHRTIDMAIYNLASDVALFEALTGALAAGDEVVLEHRRARVLSHGKHVATFDRPDRLLWKIVRFS